MFGNGAPVPQAFITRSFGNQFNFAAVILVYGYLGISILALGLIGILSKNKLCLPLLIATLFFYIVLVASNLLPPVLQAMHYSRPLFLISFLLSILAALGVEKILEIVSDKIRTTNLKQIAKNVALLAVLTILIIDLSPGLTSIQNSGFTNSYIKNIYSLLNTEHRALTSTPYLGYVWSHYSKSDFIQFSQETVNPEYNSFTYYLYTLTFDPEEKNKKYLLDISTELRLAFNTNNVIQSISSKASKVFQPSKAILIPQKNTIMAEKVFEDIIKQE
ncbi:MAG: hypothetical protein V1722_02125 [Candidatus Micrarchaeota archaeon]